MRPLSPNEEAYEDALTRWCEEGNAEGDFPDFLTWVQQRKDAEQENYLP